MNKLKSVQIKSFFGNVPAAFADGAVLFPLMAALTVQTGMDGAMLLGTSGVAYIAAGVMFRVPMSVQPLKSVVVAALAIGASAQEVVFSGFLLGVACLILSFCNANKLAALVPRYLVHGLQLALGIMLLTKGMQGGLIGATVHAKALFAVLVAVMLLLHLRTDKPVMGWIAAAGIFAGIWGCVKGDSVISLAAYNEGLHFQTILALLLPQIVLTLANSVVGTSDVAQKYFGNSARLVTATRLLRSIGIGNILVAPMGGLPFCHGAGGVTAHVNGGAQNWHMNLIIGGTLIALAAMSVLMPYPLIPAYPKVLVAALLLATGWFHMHLAKASWEHPDLRWGLVAMGLAALFTQNMLWVLTIGVMFAGVRHLFMKSREEVSK